MPDHRFQWEQLPGFLMRAIAGSSRLAAGTAAVELAKLYGTPPGQGLVRENWEVLRDEWLPHADDVRQALVAQLWELGVGYANHYPTGRDAEMAFLRTCNNARRLREAVLAQLIPLGEGPEGHLMVKSPAEKTAGSSESQARR
jgi:hypothetical protein